MPAETNNNHPAVCDYEGSDYQTSFWDHGGRAYEDAAEQIALRRLLPKGGKRMLEIGAGAGRNTLRYKGFDHIVLVDYSLTQLQQAQARLGKSEKFTYVAADVYRLPFVDGLFDGATMIRVLHHIVEGPQALSEIRRTLERNAVFILEYANKRNFKAIFRYLLKRQDWNPFDPSPVEFVKLNFNFHPTTTRRWLTEAGFRIRRQLTVSHFRIGALKRVLPTKVLAAFDSVLQLTGGLFQFSPSVFVQTEATGTPSAAAPGAFFRCPSCGETNLTQTENTISCTCGDVWAIRERIYDFREPI